MKDFQKFKEYLKNVGEIEESFDYAFYWTEHNNFKKLIDYNKKVSFLISNNNKIIITENEDTNVLVLLLLTIIDVKPDFNEYLKTYSYLINNITINTELNYDILFKDIVYYDIVYVNKNNFINNNTYSNY